MKYFSTIIILGLFLISGCVATTDLVSSGTLPPVEASIAQSISDRVGSRCVTTSYDRNTGEKIGGETKIKQRVEIIKLSKSKDGWYKAEARSQGVWADVYFNPSIDLMVCGKKSWEQYSNSNEVIFIDINSTLKKLPNTPEASASEPKILNPNKFTQQKSIAIIWEGYPQVITGLITLDNRMEIGDISIILPNKDGQCTGKYDYSSQYANGKWTIICTNGMSASGANNSHLKNNTSSGVGQDLRGNSVQFAIE